MSRGWALVTGGGRRLGRAVALQAAAAGFDVVVHYNASRGEAEAVARDIEASGVRAALIGGDLSDPDIAADIVPRAIAETRAPLAALVNSAAIFEHDALADFTPRALARHIAINTTAPILLSRAFAAALPEAARGAIVNFLDFKLAQPYPDHFSYTLSKYALMGAGELLTRALLPRVRVNAVAPGYVLPAPGQPEADYLRLHAQTPLERGATAEELAQAVVFLLTNEAITGQTIYVDAGLRLESHERDFAFR
jgi:NAD(P)-dependent dehydrogenase (short-subunit alcohol dehydrogenase family)